ncbi:MAG TPA: hypothetical protein DEP35_09970, partial [Deltaproteobacteria bacterium]|nr:hypothetical protein [Deltaproteobacteria bacterium]
PKDVKRMHRSLRQSRRGCPSAIVARSFAAIEPKTSLIPLGLLLSTERSRDSRLRLAHGPRRGGKDWPRLAARGVISIALYDVFEDGARLVQLFAR